MNERYKTKNLYLAFKESGTTLEYRLLVNLNPNTSKIEEAQKEGFKVVQVLYGGFLNLLAFKGVVE